MQGRRTISLSIGLIFAFLFAALLSASENQTAVKPGQPNPVWGSTGKEMFSHYCAVCHGNDAKGSGRAADSLKASPPNLTILSRKNGGQFPSAHLINVLRGEANLPSHANNAMPVWAPAFASPNKGGSAGSQQRLAKLLKYLESLQEK